MSIGNVSEQSLIWILHTEHRTLLYKSNKSLFAILLQYMN